MNKFLSIFACLTLSVFLVGCSNEKKVDKTVDTTKKTVEKDGKTTTVEEKTTKEKTVTKDNKDAPPVPETKKDPK